MAQEIWSLLLHLFYVWNKCIKMAHKIWSTLVHGGIFETSVKTWPIEFGPHFCTCFDFKTSVKNGLQHTFVFVLLLKQMYENGPQILVHTFEVEWVYETIVEKWPNKFGPLIYICFTFQTSVEKCPNEFGPYLFTCFPFKTNLLPWSPHFYLISKFCPYVLVLLLKQV